jgi:YD repeat-containing protein
MKIAKTFRLSEEAVAELDKQANATQYLEDLILDTRPQAVTLTQVYDLLEQFAEKHLIKGQATAEAKGGDKFVPRPPDPLTGYPCCEKSSPCKHWSYDGNDALWRNVLTGVSREA